jgi:hypothetical protein
MKKMSLKNHRTIGLAIRSAQKALRSERSSMRLPKSAPESKRYVSVLKDLDRLRSRLENRMFKDHHEELEVLSNDEAFGIYYGK